MKKRVIVIGGPMSGKSTFAQQSGLPHYCTDKVSQSRDRYQATIYMPEMLTWSEQSDFIVSQWFSKPGPWIIEGVAAVRALRKWVAKYPNILPCNEIIVLNPKQSLTEGQLAMSKGVMSIWSEISVNFVPITKYI